MIRCSHGAGWRADDRQGNGAEARFARSRLGSFFASWLGFRLACHMRRVNNFFRPQRFFTFLERNDFCSDVPFPACSHPGLKYPVPREGVLHVVIEADEGADDFSFDLTPGID
jgi:hypothetical protein